MYAVVEDGGKQYRVAEGDRIDVELRKASPDTTIEFDRVLFCNGGTPLVGSPYLPNVRVRGKVEAEIKGPKTIHYRFRRRENYERKVGHRQRYLRVRITDIIVS